MNKPAEAKGVILITGATGMLGQALSAEALRRKLHAIGLARSGAAMVVDISRDGDLAAALDRLCPNTIINAAALTDVDACERNPADAWLVNTHSVGLLASWADRNGARLVQISTDHYFTGDGPARHDENARVHLLNVYARTKYAAEALALSCQTSLVIRVNITGLRRWPNRPTFAEWAIATIVEDRPARLFDDVYVSTIDTPSCAKAIFDLLEKGTAGLINVGSRDVFSKKVFIETLADRLGRRLTKASAGTVHDLAVARPESLGLSVERAERLLGYRLPGLPDVVSTIASEYRKTSCAMTM